METIYLTIRAPTGIIFSGQILSLTAENSTGRFDVLAHHQDFLSIIKGRVVVNKIDLTTQLFEFPIAVIKVKDQKVDIFTSIKDIG